MDETAKQSWENVLNPKILKNNIINASIYSMAFEILKSCIKDNIVTFYTSGFDENGFIVSKKYKDKVLVLNRNPIFASLEWLKKQGAIDGVDVELFKTIKQHRNELTHELLKVASEGCSFDISASLANMMVLLKKIELWWFINFELEVNPENYPKDINVDDVLFSRLITLQVLIQTALGSEEEAMRFYNKFASEFKN